ncbi:MAG: FeoB-associated Cys-rich membrane protein [Oscillospiraceae bacterium]|nr:FeoB-associated Cys-rich membrane protein [Oscillospiraceae bacterium]
MIDYIVIGVVVLVVAAAGWHIYSQKKKGVKCIGCPDSKTCSGNCSGCSGNCSNRT